MPRAVKLLYDDQIQEDLLKTMKHNETLLDDDLNRSLVRMMILIIEIGE